MKIIKKLRNATEHGKEATHRALEHALESGRNLERHLRQKMRIYPHPRPAVAPTSRPNSMVPEEEELERLEAESCEREPIISVNGRDIAPAEQNGKPRSSSDSKVA